MNTEKKNLHLVQVLRGVASILVVFFHTTGNSRDILPEGFLFNFLEHGMAGVDIFFVLSGFIITYTGLNNPSQKNKTLSFLLRRSIRIYPTYWIIATGFLILQLLLPSFYRSGYVPTFLNLLSTYSLWPGHLMLNGVSWTLSYELFFYLLFTLLFLLPHKKWAFGLFILYSILLIALPILGIVKKEIDLLYVITSPMNAEFFMGMLAALIIPKIAKEYSLALILAGCFMFIGSNLYNDEYFRILPESFNRTFLFGVPSFFMIVGIVRYEQTHHVNVPKIFLSLGDASYSLYLFHLPVIVAAIKIIPKLNITNTFLIHLLLLSVIIALCFISILFFNYIEKPIIKKLNSIFFKKRMVAPATQ